MADQRGIRGEIDRVRRDAEERIRREKAAAQSEALFREAVRQREAKRQHEILELQIATYAHIRDLAAVAGEVWRDEAGITESDFTTTTIWGRRISSGLSEKCLRLARKRIIEDVSLGFGEYESRIETDYSVYLSVHGLLRAKGYYSTQGSDTTLAGYVVPEAKLDKSMEPSDQPIVQLYAKRLITVVGNELAGGKAGSPIELGVQ